VDLTPMGAAERGVSRKHAHLSVEDNRLLLTDLDSLNGTYLRGIRLAPHVPTVLRKGDQILLGRLAIEVNFE
jgi:pSer/pThr/pTyr-binding forkhead associated (FHA) protein